MIDNQLSTLHIVSSIDNNVINKNLKEKIESSPWISLKVTQLQVFLRFFLLCFRQFQFDDSVAYLYLLEQVYLR